jgi:hypothetical protein
MNASAFNFDEEIDRRAVPALKAHPIVLGKMENIFSRTP